MKALFKSILSVIIIVIFISPSTSYATSSENLESQYRADTPVSYQQLKAQVDFFNQAIDQLGATSLNQYTAKTKNFNSSILKADMEFHVKYIKEEKMGKFNYSIDNISYIPLKNARIILIDNGSGEIVKSGFTDRNGLWKTDITAVSKDPRFKNKEIGSVTTITVAEGFNETVLFNIPVNEFDTFTSSGRIILHVVNPKGRNEPHFDGAIFHRFTVFEMLDDYAQRMGLTRQPAFNKYETPPWSPK